MPADRPAAARPVARKPAAVRPPPPPPSRPHPRGAGAPPRPPAARGWRPFRRVPGKQLAAFTGRLETLVNAGLPLVRCLRILENQLPRGPLKQVVAAVAEDVEGGAPLSEGLAKYPQVFDRLYVNMVRAGEAGGVLGTILDRLAGFARKREAIAAQVRTAMTYPVLVLCFAALVLTGTMLFLVPRFETMFDSYDIEMPALTQGLLSISRALVDHWYLLVLLPVLLLLGWRLALRSEAFARQIDRLALALPFAGQVTRKTIVARFSRTLGTLLASGVPILEALSIVRASLSNRVVGEAVDEVHDAIREGGTMARPLAESGVFDDMVVNMIDVGEETGQLSEMLLRVANDHEAEIDTSIAVLFKALEPLLLLLVALVVGLIAFALFWPMVRLMESFSGAAM